MTSAQWLCLGVSMMGVAGAADGIDLEAGDLRWRLTAAGGMAECIGPPQGRQLLAANEHPVFLLLKWQGQEHEPSDPETLRREAGLHQEAPTLAVSRDGDLDGHSALRLSATYTGTGKPSFVTRVCSTLPAPLDLSRNRGLGLWVEGDGKGETLFVEIQDGQMVRPYYVPIDFSGSRYIELPLGEVSLSRYYDYEWNNWSSFASWWVTLKGSNYARVAMVTLGFNAIPAGTAVSCRVAGIKALRELPAKVDTLTVAVAGQRVSYPCALEPFQYLIDEGAGPAQVYDPNYHVLRRVERAGAVVLQPGPNRLTLTSAGAGPAPWVRFQANAVGSAETVRAR